MSPAPFALGLALSLLASVVRTRGWFTSVQAGCQDAASKLRFRDVVRAYFSGAGLNGVLPGRAGDAVKLAVLRRHAPDERYSTLAATLAPPAAVEGVFSVAVVAWAVAAGLFPLARLSEGSGLMEHRLTLALACLPAAIVIWVLARRLPGLTARLRQGVAIVRRPRQLLSGVVAWHGAARVIRLGGLAAFMAAFSLPVTPSTALLVMALQGATPSLGAATTPLRAVAVAYSFPHAAGHHVSVARVTEFLIAMQLTLVVANLVVAVALLALQLRSISPGRRLAEVQQLVAAMRPALRRTPA